MAGYFFDSSAVVKRYLTELGSNWVRGITDPSAGHDIYLAVIAGAEVVSAFIRRSPPLPPAGTAKALADFQLDFQSQYQLVAVTPAVVSRAMSLAETHRLRGYDSVQLATGLELAAVRQGMKLHPFTFVSADSRLNTAAKAEGLVVDSPLDHP